MRKHYLLLALVISIFFFQSCRGDQDDSQPNITSNTELLCASPWKAYAATIDPALNIGGKMVTDFLTQFEDCEIDDCTKYNIDGTGIYDEGPTKCDSTYPQTSSISWSFTSNDETTLTEDGETYYIKELNETTLIYDLIFDGSVVGEGATPGIDYTMTFSFSH
jgi:hypothetical protein